MRIVPTLILGLLISACGGETTPEAEPEVQPLAERETLKLPALTPQQRTETFYYPLDTCLVSGRPLAANSFNAIVEGRLVRLYSQAELPAFEAKRAKLFAKLDRAYLDRQLAHYPLKTCCFSGKPLGAETRDLLLDPRSPFAERLYRAQREAKQPYRYTIAWRLIRLADAEAEAAFKADPEKAHSAVLKVIDAYATASRSTLGETHNTAYTCAVNMQVLGREEQDLETGGFRAYICNEKVIWVCCRSCQWDISDLESPRDLAAWLYLAQGYLLESNLTLKAVQSYNIARVTQQHLAPEAMSPPPGTHVDLVGTMTPVAIDGNTAGARFAIRGRGAVWVEGPPGTDLGALVQKLRSRKAPYQRVYGVTRQLTEHPTADKLPPDVQKQVFTVTIDVDTLRPIDSRSYQALRPHLRMIKPN